MLKMTQSVGDMPLDAIAFCDLVARILYRCLKDQETSLLLFPVVSDRPVTDTPQVYGQDTQKMAQIIN